MFNVSRDNKSKDDISASIVRPRVVESFPRVRRRLGENTTVPNLTKDARSRRANLGLFSRLLFFSCPEWSIGTKGDKSFLTLIGRSYAPKQHCVLPSLCRALRVVGGGRNGMVAKWGEIRRAPMRALYERLQNRYDVFPYNI